ncbi:uncharacterized protein LOC142747908 [Rhinoderma darwinii]|uniref:uncharacterized protein LOC142747908 n=1 Tax=Rhinoderma darwinii TaxID=43563 RepID=UPI003F67AC13
MPRTHQTDLYRKETSTNSLLHATSSHPRHTIDAIPVGQFLRVKKICSTNEDLKFRFKELGDRFTQRGYSQRSIRKARDRASKTNRQQLLQVTQRSGTEPKVRFVTTFNSRWTEMRSVLYKFWPILLSDPTLSKVLPPYPAMAPRRAPNLRDAMVRSYLSPIQPGRVFGTKGPKWGCKPCGDCISCPNIERIGNFTDSSGKQDFKICWPISCGTKGVIYYALCPCPKIYVGMTTRELRLRVREHVRDIENAKTADNIEQLKTIPRHFRSHHACNSKMLKIRGIDHINLGMRGGDLKKCLLQRECKWIWRLQTMYPAGLNETAGYSSFL